MPTWSIAESGTEVPLDPGGRGQVSFVVQNVSAGQDRAVLVVDPLDGAGAGWFTVANAQQVVKPSESVTFLCQVAVPPGTAPATYALQGRVYSADQDPTETSVASRRVTFTVAAAPVKEKRPGWPVALSVALLVLVLGVVGWLLLRGGGPGGLSNTVAPTIAPATAPAVGAVVQADPGQWSEANDQLGFSFQWQRCDTTGGACTDVSGATDMKYAVLADDIGHTLRTTVTARFPADAATGQSVFARSNPVGPVPQPPPKLVAVPNVVGRAATEAVGTLQGVGFVVEELAQGNPTTDCSPPITAQVPAPGNQLQKGSKVTIVHQPILPVQSVKNQAGLVPLCFFQRAELALEPTLTPGQKAFQFDANGQARPQQP